MRFQPYVATRQQGHLATCLYNFALQAKLFLHIYLANVCSKCFMNSTNLHRP